MVVALPALFVALLLRRRRRTPPKELPCASVHIDPAAFVDPSATLSAGATVHAHAIIGRNVQIGARCVVGAGSVIADNCVIGRGNTLLPYTTIGDGTTGCVAVIGDGNRIGPHAVIGTPGEDSETFKPPSGPVVIGNHNEIRAFVVVNSPTDGRGLTTIGDDCKLMHGAGVCHDARVADGVVMYPTAQLAGFIALCRGARVGLGGKVHQRSTVGAGAMVAMGTAVVHDVPPFVLYVNQRCVRLNVFLLKKEFEPCDLNAAALEYRTWLLQEYRQRAHDGIGGSGLAPDSAVPANEMPAWVGQTAPARFMTVLELFFRERHGGRKLAPLATEFL